MFLLSPEMLTEAMAAWGHGPGGSGGSGVSGGQEAQEGQEARGLVSEMAVTEIVERNAQQQCAPPNSSSVSVKHKFLVETFCHEISLKYCGFNFYFS